MNTNDAWRESARRMMWIIIVGAILYIAALIIEKALQ
jgi:hypothetical protein